MVTGLKNCIKATYQKEKECEMKNWPKKTWSYLKNAGISIGDWFSSQRQSFKDAKIKKLARAEFCKKDPKGCARKAEMEKRNEEYARAQHRLRKAREKVAREERLKREGLEREKNGETLWDDVKGLVRAKISGNEFTAKFFKSLSRKEKLQPTEKRTPQKPAERTLQMEVGVIPRAASAPPVDRTCEKDRGKVRFVQETLVMLGQKHVKIDGLFGPQTLGALKAVHTNFGVKKCLTKEVYKLAVRKRKELDAL
jgi:hypothetical protein